MILKDMSKGKRTYIILLLFCSSVFLSFLSSGSVKHVAQTPIELTSDTTLTIVTRHDVTTIV